jgi:hypothetical protein
MLYEFPRYEVIPLPEHQVSFRFEGKEKLRWHFGPQYPRPFFFPFLGPSGEMLTRMGHPGAPNHDHHRSIWFAHHKVLGIDFWGDNSPARIRQKQWLAYQDGKHEAMLAVLLGWYDGHDPKELLTQQLIVSFRVGSKGETLLELQSTFTPTAERLTFEKTNFGFLAVRMAKSLSEFFGTGTLTNSEGKQHEADLFAKPAKWVDYRGEVVPGKREGITYFDHPSNPGHPVSWHVREDGWMGAAVCLSGPVETTRAKPLQLRYLLCGSAGELNAKETDAIFQTFAESPALEAIKSQIKHTEYRVRRAGSEK